MKLGKRIIQVFSLVVVLGCVFMPFQSAFAGAIVSGSVAFEGTAPEAMPLKMAADPSCAQLHTSEIKSETVVVNGNGTLKNVVIYIKEGLEEEFDVPKESVVLDQVGCIYEPHVIAVQANQNIEIINSDATLHNVHAVTKVNKGFNLGMPIKGMKFKKKFSEPEFVKVKCDVHPWMNSYVAVIDNPFHGVTGADGSFKIEGLPEGDYVLAAWHEKYGEVEEEVSVDADGSAEVNFTFSA